MYSSVLQPHKQTLTLLAICVPLFWGFLFWFITFKDSRIDKNTRVLFEFFNPLPSSRLWFSPLHSVGSFDFLGKFDVLSEMLKRDSASVCFDQSLGVDNGAVAKLRYQTLVGEFLELQKDFVSRKRKLHAAKQKRDTILAEVRFLRRRRNDLLQNQAFNTDEDPIHLSNSYKKNKALKGKISFDGLEAMPENSNRFPLSDSHNGETEGVRDNEVLGLKPMNSVIHHKTTAEVLCWAILLNWIRIMVMLSQPSPPAVVTHAYGFTHHRKSKSIMVHELRPDRC